MTYPQPPKRDRTNLVAVLAIAFILVAGGVVAIVVTTSGGDDATTSAPTVNAAEARKAAARDAAIRDGTTIAEVFNTIDYTKAEQDLRKWESYATGDLLAELKKTHDQSVRSVTDAKSKARATVLSAALADFDPNAGTARLLAAVKVDVTAQDQPTTKRLRITVTLTMTAGGWKASAISPE